MLFRSGTLYEDAGDGYGYRSGDYLLTTYVAKLRGNKLRVRVAASEGHRTHAPREIVVQVVTDDGVVTAHGAEDKLVVTLPSKH